MVPLDTGHPPCPGRSLGCWRLGPEWHCHPLLSRESASPWVPAAVGTHLGQAPGMISAQERNWQLCRSSTAEWTFGRDRGLFFLKGSLDQRGARELSGARLHRAVFRSESSRGMCPWAEDGALEVAGVMTGAATYRAGQKTLLQREKIAKRTGTCKSSCLVRPEHQRSAFILKRRRPMSGPRTARGSLGLGREA